LGIKKDIEVKGLIMSKVKTDIELAKLFSEEIYENYKTALEFLRENPDYSLLKFRKIIESLCALIADKFVVEFSSDSLFELINTLERSEVINRNTKNLFHDLRILCNNGVHGNNVSSTNDDITFIEEVKSLCIKKAESARKLIVKLYEDIYLLLGYGKSISQVELVDYSLYEFKQLIFDATVSLTYQAKLKAGIAYETIAQQATIGMPLVVENSFQLHHHGLLKLAASHYYTALRLSFEESLYRSDTSKVYLYCDVESLFRYAVIATSGVLGEDKFDEGFKLVKIAADRGYNEAIAFYGAYLFDEERFEESKDYLTRAIKVDSAMANRYLFYFYTEIKLDKNLAKKHLQKAIELGCCDSIGELGILYHKGFIVDKDIDKAEVLLLEAIGKGSYVAKRYHIVEFNDLVGQMQKGAQDFLAEFDKAFEQVQNEIAEAKPKPIKAEKINRNSSCPCGSKKKYKKCCGGNIVELKKENIKLNIFSQ